MLGGRNIVENNFFFHFKYHKTIQKDLIQQQYTNRDYGKQIRTNTNIIKLKKISRPVIHHSILKINLSHTIYVNFLGNNLLRYNRINKNLDKIPPNFYLRTKRRTFTLLTTSMQTLDARERNLYDSKKKKYFL